MSNTCPNSIVIVDTKEAAIQVRIQKWGNSLALRIPKSLAEDAGVNAGSLVDFRAVRGKLIATPLRGKYELEELLAGVSKANLHGEVDSGEALGQEVW
ncbi:MAG: AbrB/MazE/SpoVT family DNA-binding domain-containing protein [Actinomycetota bacterium]